MAIERVIANKRCLMITKNNIETTTISIRPYDILLKQNDYALITYPYQVFVLDRDGKQSSYMLSLCDYKSLNGTYTVGNIVTQNSNCIYNYESNEFTLKVLTLDASPGMTFYFKNLFRGTKWHKILNIYFVDYSEISSGEPPTSNVKIYYLQKN
uniref:Uncharacterized protein n=1 Tax=Podoviridae sp. cty7j44 TaxID=2826593 RepID=A0A8S5QY19_9CAUD|nr:MAG TPA: hypothetical protein [Podoviridae sp. cty7j44]